MYDAQWLLMLDGDSLILLDVMKVVFATCFILSRQSFNQAHHARVCYVYVYVYVYVFQTLIIFKRDLLHRQYIQDVQR